MLIESILGWTVVTGLKVIYGLISFLLIIFMSLVLVSQFLRKY